MATGPPADVVLYHQLRPPLDCKIIQFAAKADLSMDDSAVDIALREVITLVREEMVTMQLSCQSMDERWPSMLVKRLRFLETWV